MGFPGGSDGKESARNAGDPGSIPGSGRSPGEGNGNPLQYPCLENPMDGGAWQATVYGVAKSLTRLSDFTSIHKEEMGRMNIYISEISELKWTGMGEFNSDDHYCGQKSLRNAAALTVVVG